MAMVRCVARSTPELNADQLANAAGEPVALLSVGGEDGGRRARPPGAAAAEERRRASGGGGAEEE
jgi:hypothetical protein